MFSVSRQDLAFPLQTGELYSLHQYHCHLWTLKSFESIYMICKFSNSTSYHCLTTNLVAKALRIHVTFYGSSLVCAAPLQALQEASKQLSKARGEDKEAQMELLAQKQANCQRFIEAKQTLAADPARAVAICQAMLAEAPEGTQVWLEGTGALGHPIYYYMACTAVQLTMSGYVDCNRYLLCRL
jgi:hypothetical protein